MNFAIVILTYKRRDGKTPFFLKRALESVFNQTYNNFKIFLIGDKYEDNDEFLSIIKSFDNKKIYYENLPFAKERDKYSDKWVVWSYAGTYASNYGINKAVSEGFDYVCHLDHDDWWLPNHLEEINNCIVSTEADWLCTKSTYNSPNVFLPRTMNNEIYQVFLPKSSSLIHSSVCINFKKIPLRYKNIYEETGKIGLPGDAELWERMRSYIIENNLKSFHINKLTCRHDEEGYERK